MRAVVVGAGAIGLSTAYYLSLGGAEVVVLDAASPGDGASSRNAGWVVPAMSEPVPSPAALRSGLRWLGHRESPLRVGFPKSLADAGFLAEMALNCRPGPYARGLAATAELNRTAAQCFRDLETDGVQFEHHRRNLLLAFTKASSIEPHLDDLQAMEQYGNPRASALTAAEIRDLEPNLSDRVRGGICIAGQSNLAPASFIAGLAARCTELGVRIVSGETVVGIDVSAGAVRSLQGDRQWRADHYVLAAGVWSGRVLRSAGVRLPIMAGKGYGFDLPAGDLRHPIYLGDHRVAVSPLNAGTRICGTMEFGQPEFGRPEFGGPELGAPEFGRPELRTGNIAPSNGMIDQRRAAGILASARLYLPSLIGGAEPKPWTGVRPMTPDGLPILGLLPGTSNLTIATGHAMLGITLAPVTGKLLAQSVLTSESATALLPFGAARFRSLRALLR